MLAVGNAFAIILDADDHPLAMATCLQTDLAVPGGMTQGVIDKVVEHPIKLRLVSLQARQWSLYFHSQIDAFFRRQIGKA